MITVLTSSVYELVPVVTSYTASERHNVSCIHNAPVVVRPFFISVLFSMLYRAVNPQNHCAIIIQVPVWKRTEVVQFYTRARARARARVRARVCVCVYVYIKRVNLNVIWSDS